MFIAAYNQLKCETGDECILFIYGVHPAQGTKWAYGWMPKGRKTMEGTSGSCTRVNLVGTVILVNIGNTVIREYETINAENIA